MTGQNSGDGMRNAIAGYLQIPKVQASSCQQKQAECAMSTTSLQSAVLSATFYVNTCVVRGYQPRSTIHIHCISSPHLRISAKEGSLPHAEAAAREVLSLPNYPELTEHQQETIVNAVTRFFSHASVNAEREE